MTWVRLESDWFLHEKFASAGEAATLLWLKAIAWSVHRRKDGLVPSEVLPQLANPRKALDLAGRLVEVGLFERQGEDFVIHDFLHYQPTRELLEQKRIAGRQGGKARSAKVLKQNGDSAQPTPTPTPTPVVSTSHDSYQLGRPQPGESENVENGVTLRKRLVSACEKRGSNVEREAQQVLSLLQPYFDDRVLEEMVGTMENLDKPAQWPRYMLGMAPKWGADRGIEIPDLRSRLKS